MVKIRITILLAFLVALSLTALAVPNGPNSITRGASERGGAAVNPGVLQQAEAGNTTPLIVNGDAISRRWQGYYGNVTGDITLDDAGGNSLYTWTLTQPQGEIFAVNHSTAPAWSSVVCFNFTRTDSEQNITLTELEGSLGIGTTDRDGVNETFNHTFTGSFTVGAVTIDVNDGCQHVSLNVNDAYNALRFNETLLTDNSTDKVIYVSLIEQDQTNFKNHPADFQIIVGENGDVTGPTDYYFYVELS